MAKANPTGVLVVDKPEGPTSHDVVARVRRALKTSRVGHAGTLDPMATGVLVVAVGEATKLVPWLTADDKAYQATILLGVETDTLDAQGKETARIAVPDAIREAIAAGRFAEGPLLRALDEERARTEQVPPIFSAIRIDGERAHELARRGEVPELAPRPVAMRSLEILGAEVIDEGVLLRVVLDVTKGYFVRALARDLSAALGTCGHLTALRRTRSGGFTLDHATSLEAITEASLEPIERAAARALPVTVLDEEGARAAGQGKRVPAHTMREPHPRPSAWLDERGRLVAIGETTPEGAGRVLRGFPTPSLISH